MKRAVVVAFGAALIAVGVETTTAYANHTNGCVVLTPVIPQGGTLTIGASRAAPSAANKFFRERIGGAAIANGQADGVGHMTISGSVPIGFVPGLYPVDVVQISGPGVGFTLNCGHVEIRAAAATPTPTPTRTPAPPPRRPRRARRRPPPPPPQQQQQQQQQQQLIVPAAVHTCCFDDNKLPKTGFDANEVGALGSGSLAVGVSLVEFARRRRRNWDKPDESPHRLEELNWTPKPYVPHVPPVTDPVTSSEVDLLLPYEGEVPPDEKIPLPDEPPDVTPYVAPSAPAGNDWPFPPLFDDDDVPHPSF